MPGFWQTRKDAVDDDKRESELTKTHRAEVYIGQMLGVTLQGWRVSGMLYSSFKGPPHPLTSCSLSSGPPDILS